MGLFSKPNQVCTVCGMDDISSGVCRYCGTKVAAKIANMSSAANINEQGLKTRNTLITTAHVHTNQHVIQSKNKGKTVAKKPQRQVARQTHRQSQVRQDAKKKSGFGTLLARFIFLGLLIGWGTCLTLLFESFENQSGRVPELGYEAGVIIAIIVFLLAVFSGRAALRSLFTIFALSLTSFLLIIKPLVAPVKHFSNNVWQPFSFQSETHMFFWVPGMMLAVFAAGYFLSVLIKFFKWMFK